MPGKQTAPTTKGTPQRKPQQQAQGRGAAVTGERDETYAVISVLYHALQGAETIAQYIQDAREADDEELAAFFEETREAYVERANEAKQLLASRLEASDEDEEDEDEEDEEEDEEEED